MKSYIQQIYHRPAFWLAAFAGVLYSSWPWAFVLNPSVLHHSLASQLQEPGQPWAWVFIAGDSLTGAVLAWVALLQYRAFAEGGRSTRWSIAGYLLFGALAAVAALVPLDCDPQAHTCGQLIRDPFVLIHGFASIASVLFLLASVVILTVLSYSRQAAPVVRQGFMIILALWGIFGIGSIAQFWWHPGGNGMQDFFITLCSVSAWAVVAAVEYMHVSHKDEASLEELELSSAEPVFAED
jgi:Protein of unknown function (DUF998)